MRSIQGGTILTPIREGLRRSKTGGLLAHKRARKRILGDRTGEKFWDGRVGAFRGGA